MKQFLILLIAFLSSTTMTFSQPWSSAQIDSANTEISNPSLSPYEKEAILIINLCRLYPKQFASYEVEKYYNGGMRVDETFLKYKESLIQELNSREPCQVLRFDQALYDISNCFAQEFQGYDIPSHSRKNCPQPKCAESIAIGKESGFESVMQLLIDAGVENHLHRKICLDPKYSKIGLRLYSHPKFRFSSIFNFC
jgi:hypothetical protein